MERPEFSDLDTVQRCPHDPENPYTMIKNDLLRDNTLSDGCVRLICYLLSNKNDWKITMIQIVNHMKNVMGRTKVYELVKEAIAAGYMMKQTAFSKNLKSKVKYFVSETPKFNQTLLTPRYPDFRYAELRLTENHHTQEEYKKEEYKKEEKKEEDKSAETRTEFASSLPPKVGDMDCVDDKPKRSRKHAEFTTEVKKLTAEMVETIFKHEPEYKAPKNLSSFMNEVDYMLRLDKRDPEKILEVLNWSLADNFWRDKMFKPNIAKYLRDKYLQLKNQMEAPGPKKERKFAPCSDDKQAYETLKEMDKRAL
jgi:hypothetical protein